MPFLSGTILPWLASLVMSWSPTLSHISALPSSFYPSSQRKLRTTWNGRTSSGGYGSQLYGAERSQQPLRLISKLEQIKIHQAPWSCMFKHDSDGSLSRVGTSTLVCWKYVPTVVTSPGCVSGHSALVNTGRAGGVLGTAARGSSSRAMSPASPLSPPGMPGIFVTYKVCVHTGTIPRENRCRGTELRINEEWTKGFQISCSLKIHRSHWTCPGDCYDLITRWSWVIDTYTHRFTHTLTHSTHT